MNAKVGEFESPSGGDILKKFDTFTRKSVRVSKMGYVEAFASRRLAGADLHRRSMPQFR